ncbi:hypothetical protein [Stenotrophomonas sp. CFBP8994]|uniref:hypothetical protein n=1 Tax=Stenotrophomonas sp. CFBP8994 TaxID=3096527 RepID=UPI002A69FE86|nr:hypothetical protein [Stenotrophomonas sp. CFBP8994]MDY0978954.1 hypothetical protein [Stenotrophomonas sp. CFBP8994]
MPGSVNAAAAYLTKRRGVSIKGESLRKKLRGLEGESLSMEMMEMLTDWMVEQAAGTPVATDWILSLAAQFNLAIDHVPAAPDGGWPNEIDAIKDKLLHVSKFCGQLSAVALDVLQDNRVTLEEADRMLDALQAVRTMCHRMERNLRRAVAKGRQRD